MKENYELQKRFDEIGSNGDIAIYCHFTNASGEEILENNLYVGNPEWYKSFLKLDENELANICAFIDDNGKRAMKVSTMIVVAIYKDLEDYFITESQEDNDMYMKWSGENAPDYVVDNKFILGYVDINTKEFVINSHSLIAEDLMIL